MTYTASRRRNTRDTLRSRTPWFSSLDGCGGRLGGESGEGNGEDFDYELHGGMSKCRERVLRAERMLGACGHPVHPELLYNTEFETDCSDDPAVSASILAPRSHQRWGAVPYERGNKS